MANSTYKPSEILVRLFVYFVMQAVVLAAYVWCVVESGNGQLGSIDLHTMFRENGVIEFIQLGLLVTSAAIFIVSFNRNHPEFHSLLFAVSIIMIFRELDLFMETRFFENAHTFSILIILGIFLVWTFRNRTLLVSELSEFVFRPGFYLLFAGICLIVIFAQILGQREVWKMLVYVYPSETKRFIEEGLELMGYIVIMCGVVEERFFAIRKVTAARSVDQPSILN